MDTEPGSFLVWWAYIHRYDGQIHLKKWLEPPEGEMCDHQYAKEEMTQGNDNIFAIVEKPFTASTQVEAWYIAKRLFEEQGIVFKDDSNGFTSAKGVTSAIDNRFRLLDIE